MNYHSHALRYFLCFVCGTFLVFIFIAYLDNIPNHLTKFKLPSYSTTVLQKERPWYLKNGTQWPTPAKIDSKTGRRDAKLWPNEDTEGDRILNQLMFVPPTANTGTDKQLPMKKIYFPSHLITWEVIHPKGSKEPFVTCPVNRCHATSNRAESLDADAIVFANSFHHPGHHKPARQVWIMYTMESPVHTWDQTEQDVYNWTATYMRSSDIVRAYDRWVYYDMEKTEWEGPPRNFATNKTGQVAWFVSNCAAKNNRLEYARELAGYIQVDMYGGCGAKYQCPHSDQDKCYRLLETKYKFYLAFENSNCREYITEKFFENSLQHNVIPVVMGAPREDYELVAPKNSFIHVEDFGSPKDLAEYLHKVDQDDDLYNSYFKWWGMGEVIPVYFYCRLCAMLHDDFPDKYYKRIDNWWRRPDSCTRGVWQDVRRKYGGKLPEI